MEAYELAVLKRFNVLVLIAGDGDFLPLVRKLNTLGTRVMLLAWDFTWTDDYGKPQTGRTNQTLIDECTYTVMMHDLIDSRASKGETLIDNLFVETAPEPAIVRPAVPASVTPLGSPAPTGTASSPASAVADASPASSSTLKGTIAHVNPSRFCGAIKGEGGKDYLFLGTEVRDANFYDLRIGDSVSFTLGPNPKKPGEMMAFNIRRSDAPADMPATVPK